MATAKSLTYDDANCIAANMLDQLIEALAPDKRAGSRATETLHFVIRYNGIESWEDLYDHLHTMRESKAAYVLLSLCERVMRDSVPVKLDLGIWK